MQCVSFRRGNLWRLTLLAGCLAVSPHPVTATTNLSTWVFPAASGRLLARPDFLGNRVIDASGVGYKGGLVPLPSATTVPVRTTLSPVVGDNVASIQAAINYVSGLPLDTNGFRGAVLLSAGTYPCSNTVKISASGVVLRGAGSSTNGTGTVLQATAGNQYSLVQITGSGSASTVGGTTHNITNLYVPVGARSFGVDSTSGLAVGDHVFVRRVATSDWIHDIGMDLLTNPWTPDGYNIDMDRVITHIEGNHIFVDSPITCAIDAHYANGTIRKFTWSGRITNSGIEHLYAKADYFGNVTNENHGWIFVQFNSTENGWARDLVSQYFGYACVALYSGAKHITVSDCQCLDPVSIITGGRRYAFVMDDNQLCLVKNCYTRQDRHQFVTQSLTTGPNVFVDGVSDSAHAEAGPHHRWATAAIWDNITVNGHDLDAQNTCESGTGHGWEGANCLIWNSKANNLKVASPPTAINWLIGSIGNVSKGGDCHGIVSQPGAWDSSGPANAGGTNVFPHSLYFAQLQDRLAAPNLQTRDYWLGEIDGFTNSNPTGEAVPVDSAWRSAVQAFAGGQPLDGFDVVTNNHWVPFTFNFSLAPNEHVVAATLSLSMRATNSAVADVFYLDGLTNAFAFAGLGWLPVSTSPLASNATTRVLDLTGQVGLLANGQLNVAIQGDIGVDWALLELQVAANVNAGALVLMPAADATVRAGTYATSNFGTTNTLTVKNDASADNTRQAYLRWDLTGITQTVYQARVTLTPLNVGTNAIEQGVAVAASNNWAETTVTWNSQPGRGERFANWIPATNVPLSFDVTPQVLDALANDQQLSVQLFSVRNVGAAGSVDYASREYPDPASRPQLVLSLLGAPPVISAISDRLIPVNGTTGPIPFTVSDPDSAASALTLSSDSSNPGLVPDANIVFGGSGSNRTVAVTPAPNQSGVALVTITVSDPSGLFASTSFTLTVGNHTPGAFIWNGPGAGANAWSTSGYWSPAGPPEAFDDVKFFDRGAGGVAVSNINNSVDASFGGTVASVQYGNTNGNHTTLIASGETLTLAGANGLLAGTETDNGTAQAVFATVTGPAGALVMNNPAANLVVRQGTANSGGSQRATLDLSGVGTFNATLSQVLVGFAGPVNRASGTLYLAKTNTITATGTPGIGGGDNSSNSGGQSLIYLGQTNALFADSITIARQKATATLKFRPGLVNPAAYFRASDGFSRVSAWNIADNSLQSTSSSSSLGTNDFSGGTLDALVDTLIVGKSQKSNGADSIGVLTFTAGTLDVNTLQVGFQAQSGATSAGVGRVNVSGPGALLVINSVLELGHTGGGTGSTNTIGTLFINGGTVQANTISAGAGSGSNSLGLNNGTLVVSNTAGLPGAGIASVSLTNSALQFFVASGLTNMVVTNLVAAGSANTINVGYLPSITTFPAQFPLISYSSIGGPGYNFVLGSQPPGTFCGAYLSNNVASSSVDLVVTNCLVSDSFLTWNGNVSADWDMETPNWMNNLTTGLSYADGNSVVFNDTATGATDIALTDVLTPASVTVSNTARTYTFGDSGALSGGMVLRKQGPGILVLAHEGLNDFTGGVTIDGGTLQVGNGGTDGNLPAGTVIDNGTLAFNRSDDMTVANLIVGAGGVIQNGTNTLTLSAANTFTGGVTVVRGTLQVANASALGVTNDGTTVASGATLDLNHFNIGLEPVTVTGAGADGNGALADWSGNPNYVSPSVAYVTLAGDTTFGGTGRWDLRSASTTSTNAALSTTGHAYKLTKVGTNQISLVAVLVDPTLGDIDVQAGTLSVEKVITSLGNPTNSLSVSNGATLQFYQVSNVLSKVLVLRGGAMVLNNSGGNTFGGPVTLQGTNTFNAGGTSLKFTNVLSGAGGLAKIGSSTLFLSGANTYTGDTLISSGTLALTGSGSIASSRTITVASGATLDVSTRDDLKLTLASGQTLSGNGTITPNLLVGAGATLSPGSGINLGTLTVTATAMLQGTTLMKIDKAQARTNDQFAATSGLFYGGTLSLTNVNLALPWQRGDTFKLFAFGTFFGGSFTLVPATPGPGLLWDTNLLATTGTLKVVAAPATPPTVGHMSVAGGTLVISGSGGTPGTGYYVLGSTNLALPRTYWTRLLTNSFDASGNFTFTNPLPSGALQRFYLLQLQ
jgi:autotransporter-associated beta strand protein